MSGVMSPEFACGQVLFSIKMSKLNYLVQETPCSIHVTLRKKFVKEAGSRLFRAPKKKFELELELARHHTKTSSSSSSLLVTI